MTVYKRGKRYGVNFSHLGRQVRIMVASNKSTAEEIGRQIERLIEHRQSHETIGPFVDWRHPA